MKRIGISVLKILAFLGLWAALTSGAVLTAVALGGEEFYEKLEFRVGLEIVLTVAILIPLVIMGIFVDRRRRESLGFAAGRLYDLLSGAIIGAAIFCVPLAILVGMGAATYAPDLSGFTQQALIIGIVVCLFNVITQEAIVRSYMFQELWAKYGAWAATIVTTIIFVAMHAGAIINGAQGLIAGANILLASLLLSLAYVRTGALWLAIGIHLGWNGLQGPVLAINVTGHDLAFGHWRVFEFSPRDELLTGGAMGVEGGLIGLIGPLVGIAVVALLFKQQPKPDFAPVARRGA